MYRIRVAASETPVKNAGLVKREPESWHAPSADAETEATRRSTWKGIERGSPALSGQYGKRHFRINSQSEIFLVSGNPITISPIFAAVDLIDLGFGLSTTTCSI